MLPKTGADVAPLVIGALVLLFVGLIALLIARRRRHAHPEL